MKINVNKLLKSLILATMIISIVFTYIISVKTKIDLNFGVMITFLINFIIIVINIMVDKRKYSLNKTFWYFSLFFMFLAPLLQYLSDYNMWDYSISNGQYTKNNMWLTVWFLVYDIINKVIKIKTKEQKKVNLIQIKKAIVYVLLVLSVISLIIGIYLIGFKNLFFRDENNVDLGAGNINTIVINLIRSIPVYSLLYSIYYYKKNRKGILYIVLLSIITILLNYPASVTRYWIGAVYIGILITLIGNHMSDKMFDIIMIVVFALIFPIFQMFKWYSMTDLLNGNFYIKNLISVYNNPDFDAYSMLARTFKYVDTYSITYGKQLFSSVFFFVPRSIWEAKAVPSGQLVAEAQGQLFTNLSSPLIAEGYINFGYFGIILYAILISLLIKYLDNKYWNSKNGEIRIIDFIYPFTIGFLIFLLRGAFHPAIVYISTFFLSLVICNIVRKYIRFK